jgi:N-acetylneuraminic acid mutarotase
MIWTGTEVVIWGGYGYSAGTIQYLNDGARYDPKTKFWTKFPLPAPEIDGRWDQVGVYSGKEMLIFGGYSTYLSTISSYGRNTGARYLPGGSWTSFSLPDDTTFGTTAKRFASAAWFGGGQLYVWSGANGNSSSGTALAGGASYDPTTDKWTAMDTTATGIPTARARATVAWTGKEAIIWGGSNTGATPTTTSTYYNDGAVYRP